MVIGDIDSDVLRLAKYVYRSPAFLLFRKEIFLIQLQLGPYVLKV